MIVQPSHISLIRRIAYRMIRRLPASVDVGELISDGYCGMLKAIERFDVSKGASFENFAGKWIRGAMIDGIDKRISDGRRFLPLSPHTPGRTEIDRGEMRESLGHLLRQLPRRNRLLIQLYDLEGMTMKQIAACLGVTEARISILRDRAIRKMRKAYLELEDDVEGGDVSAVGAKKSGRRVPSLTATG